MSFINSRMFGTNNEKFMIIRKEAFVSEFKLLIGAFTLGHLTLLTWYIFPIFDEKRRFPQPMYMFVDHETHFIIFWMIYLIACFVIWISAMLVGSTFLYFSMILGLMSTEFQILGESYKSMFDDILNCTNDQKYDVEVRKIYLNLKVHVIHHQNLLKYVFSQMRSI